MRCCARCQAAWCRLGLGAGAQGRLVISSRHEMLRKVPGCLVQVGLRGSGLGFRV